VFLKNTNDSKNQNAHHRIPRLFTHGILALDIAESLWSFEASQTTKEVRAELPLPHPLVIGLRKRGKVVGFAHTQDLNTGICDDYFQAFESTHLLDDQANLQETVATLDRQPFCFVRLLGEPIGLIQRSDLNKPPARMWLFGLLTIAEEFATGIIKSHYPEDELANALSVGRREKAQAFQKERARRNDHVPLVDCLQITDKMELCLKVPGMLEDVDIASKKKAQKAIKQLSTLRNHLAHGQDLTTTTWEAVVLLAGRLPKIMTRL
jgi:hypothetical protein